MLGGVVVVERGAWKGGSGEETCDFCGLGWAKGSYAVDVPGVYALGSLASGGLWLSESVRMEGVEGRGLRGADGERAAVVLEVVD